MRDTRGRFKRGADPGRHVFTPAECVDGFWKMVESITTRYPDMIDRYGTHKVKYALRFLARKNGR